MSPAAAARDKPVSGHNVSSETMCEGHCGDTRQACDGPCNGGGVGGGIHMVRATLAAVREEGTCADGTTDGVRGVMCTRHY